MLIYESTICIMLVVAVWMMSKFSCLFIRTFPIFYSDVNCSFSKSTKEAFFFLT